MIRVIVMVAKIQCSRHKKTQILVLSMTRTSGYAERRRKRRRRSQTLSQPGRESVALTTNCWTDKNLLLLDM